MKRVSLHRLARFFFSAFEKIFKQSAETSGHAFETQNAVSVEAVKCGENKATVQSTIE